MDLQCFSVLLARHPSLKNYLEQDRFLYGYGGGSEKGGNLAVFLLNSPWRDYCLQATAVETIPSGGVIVITPEHPWQLHGIWQAYAWESVSEINSKSSKSMSLASLAAEISLKSAQFTCKVPRYSF